MTKTLHDLVFFKQLKKKEVACQFSNIIQRVKKRSYNPKKRLAKKYQNLWFLKKVDSELEVARETLAQEIFRLILPRHPKTRVVADRNDKITRLMSKCIEGEFRCMDEFEYEEIKNSIEAGEIKGLGEICVMSLWVNEVDLKFGNLFLNDKMELIKIDGNWCFVGNEQNKITAKDIRSLPFVENYHPVNWFDIWYRRKRDDNPSFHISTIFQEDFNNDLMFRMEVNRTLMKIIVLPPPMLKAFVADCIGDMSKEIMQNLSGEIIKRQKAIKSAALADDAFKQYLLSDQGSYDFRVYTEELRNFKVSGKKTLGLEEYEKQLHLQFEWLVKTNANANIRRDTLFTHNPADRKRKADQIEQSTGLWNFMSKLLWPTSAENEKKMRL